MDTNNAAKVVKVVIVYDGLCPACVAYFRLVRIRQIGLQVTLVDARTDPAISAAYSNRGIDLDRTFVLGIGDIEYTGGEAMFILSGLSTSLPLFRRLNYWIFGSRSAAKIIYPVLSTARRILLRVLRLPLIAR